MINSHVLCWFVYEVINRLMNEIIFVHTTKRANPVPIFQQQSLVIGMEE